MTLKNNRAPLLNHIKLYIPFHHHMWIQTGVTVWKRPSWVVTSVTLTFDLWPWPFAWTLPWSVVITPENFMMIRWWEHSQKGVTDRQTDRQTENTIHRAAWSQLKTRTTRIRAFWGYPPPPHYYPYYWPVHIGSQVKTRQSPSYKLNEFAKTSNFLSLKKTLCTTHLLGLLDKMCKFEMDPVSIVEDTDWTRFCP